MDDTDAERVRIRDLQERLSVSRATLNRWLAAGMPSEKLGGVRLFDPEKVKAGQGFGDAACRVP